jgi:hypothetical protein
MRLDYGLAHTKAKTHALAYIPGSEKRVEYLVKNGLVNTRAIVSHLDQQSAFVVSLILADNRRQYLAVIIDL